MSVILLALTSGVVVDDPLITHVVPSLVNDLDGYLFSMWPFQVIIIWNLDQACVD